MIAKGTCLKTVFDIIHYQHVAKQIESKSEMLIWSSMLIC